MLDFSWKNNRNRAYFPRRSRAYLRFVASPPRKCRSFRFRSSTDFTFSHSSGSISANRSVTSLCTDGQKQNGKKKLRRRDQTGAAEDLHVAQYFFIFIRCNF